MRIVILTFGSRGNVQPMVALGAGLRAAGYAVRLAADAHFESLARQHGLDFAPVEGDIQAAIRSARRIPWVQAIQQPLVPARSIPSPMLPPPGRDSGATRLRHPPAQ